MRTARKGMLALVFVIFESAFLTIALDVGGIGIGVVPLLFYTSIIGALCVLPISYFKDKFKGLSAILKSRKMLALLACAGLLDYAVSRLFLTLGTIGTSPSIGGIIFRTYPLLIAVMTPLVFRQKVSGRQLLALLLGFASVYLMLSNGSILTVDVPELPYVAMLLAAAMAMTLSMLIVKRYNASTSGFMVIANVSVFAVTLPLIFALHISLPVSFSLPALASILFMGGIESGVGALVFYYPYKVFSTSFAGNAMLAIPFLTVVLSSLLLGTPIKAYYIASAALLAAGIFIQGRESLSAPDTEVEGHFQERDDTRHHRRVREQLQRGPVPLHRWRGPCTGDKARRGVRYSGTRHGKIFSARNCIAFTDEAPHADAKKDEINFVKEMLGLEEGETALIGMGSPRALEDAFEEFTNSEADRMQSLKKLSGSSL